MPRKAIQHNKVIQRNKVGDDALRGKPDPVEDRYARHRLIEGWDQERLGRAKILVAGAGAIGNEVIKLLALMGVGHLLVVDFDRVERSNLTRSVLFREEDIGRPKAVAAAERALQINPEIEVRALAGDLEFDVGLGVYRAMDLVIGCLDSLQARLALNRACIRLGVPWLNGAIEVTLAEVSLFAPLPGEEAGACFECGMSAAMWERRNRRFSCSGLQAEGSDAPVPTTAVIASLAAAYLVQEALFLLHREEGGEKEGLRPSHKVTLQLSPYDCAVYRLPANPDCLAHEVWKPIKVVDHSVEKTTARDLLAIGGAPEGVVELGLDLVTALECVGCGHRETLFRPLERCRTDLIRCPACGNESRHPETVCWLDAESEAAKVPLARLGFPEHSVFAVKAAGSRRFLQLGGPYRL